MASTASIGLDGVLPGKKGGQLPELQGKPRGGTGKEQSEAVEEQPLANGDAEEKLRSRINDLKNERHRMVNYMGGIQRNYEMLSKFCKGTTTPSIVQIVYLHNGIV